MNKILTVVVPSYNTSPYIDDGIRSLVESHYIEDIEILIINDGSKDNTEEKALIWQAKYPESIYVISKENGGHGSGINSGISHANGKYFKVVDGDDKVDTLQFDRFIEQLKTYDADMFITSFRTISAIDGGENIISPFDYRQIEKKKRVEYDVVLPSSEVLPYVYASIHATTYKTDILKKNNIRMTEKTFYEDNEFVLFPIPFVKTVFLSNTVVYLYTIDQVNQSISKTNTQKRVGELEKIVFSLIDCYNNIGSCAEESNREYIRRGIVNQIYVVFSIYTSFDVDINLHKKELISFDERIKGDSLELYELANQNKLIRTTRTNHYLLYRIICLRNGMRASRKKMY